MQNRHLTGEETNTKTKEDMGKMNGGMPLLTDLCVAMRSDPLGMIRGLGEVMTCIYGPAVTTRRIGGGGNERVLSRPTQNSGT